MEPFELKLWHKLGWQWGEVGPKNGVFIPDPPRMMEKTFSLQPRPLGPREAPFHSLKLYFLLICPITSTIFLMKLILLYFFNETYFINKIYLKLQLNLSHQINF